MGLYLHFRNLYLNKRFYLWGVGLALLLFLSYWFETLFFIAAYALGVFTLILFFDVVFLFAGKNQVTGKRQLPEKLSNGDENGIGVLVGNNYPFKVWLEIIDELPVQFQKRDFLKHITLPSKTADAFTYSVRPVARGAYLFGSLNIYANGFFRLAKRRFVFDQSQEVACYPSFIQLRKYEWMAMVKQPQFFGLKKIRRIGHTMEFEQIKDYVVGDDFRTINWKATAKASKYMVNQFQDETSQPVYSILDVGRVMKMPFEGLKLLDYAINASLAFSKVTLQKKDKCGLLTFSDKVHDILLASGQSTQMQSVMEKLYRIDTNFSDSDFSNLHNQLKYRLKQRSMLMLYTNFEHISALERQLTFLKAIAKKHLLIVIIFENTEVLKLIEKPSEQLWDIYEKTIAEKFDYDKKRMVLLLRKHNIQTLLTSPQDLTINAINKYLEIKARGLF
ncbi:MAG: DUF58 domain-containing protein [Flavobacteriaceae bacterium]|nr:DUF58 domain-containing protein [Flavobacteriaceae bacterium]